ncbi:MAG: hypothetical protein MJY62_06050, partial [Bacteroidales bacterium]|nr:hypothetical protein [Bacteroidales bacterium]
HEGSDEYVKWKKYIPSDKTSYWSGPGNPDNKTVLEPEDDIAHVTYGGSWRIPTIDEWTELKENCTWTRFTQNGVKMWRGTSSKEGFTDKSIILPEAGARFSNSLYSSEYQSSSLNVVFPHKAGTMGLYGVDFVFCGTCERCFGLPVRPVFSKQ